MEDLRGLARLPFLPTKFISVFEWNARGRLTDLAMHSCNSFEAAKQAVAFIVSPEAAQQVSKAES
jgi:hypothetical protein